MKIKELVVIVDALEEQEAKLLSWGDTGGWFSEAEIESICERCLPGYDYEDILDALEQHAMVYPIFNASNQLVGYRSRMAHAVHLYRNLRQWMHSQPLNNSKTLVSDFRFLRRPRRYPERDQRINDLFTSWRSGGLLNSTIEQAIIAQVGDFNLAGFQQRATERILKAWPKHKSRVRHSTATIVCSGTGSGKTLSFYLPALSSLASDLSENASPRVRILAIYPRNELLKDQFNETWQACRKLDGLTQATVGRKIRIGALFGGIAENSAKASQNKSYTNTGLIKCTSLRCEGEMIWHADDVSRSFEQLTCNRCGAHVGNDEVMLTRSAMDLSPPDILFTTTEMLNQQIGRPGRQKLFGINTEKPIPLVLMDEVHTYGGSQGAQTAFLLRRWMTLAKTSPHFVGLSATLADAENFFSRLTGTNPSRVRLVEPQEFEMKEEGAEYLVALRGDPVSQTALLSTTIQASMLTRRLLDSYQQKPSKGIWGSKTFIFTDDLDVNNRLYSQLADAEGWWQRGTDLTPNRNGPLAQLRNHNNDNAPSQYELSMFGQDWSALQRNGFSLDHNDRAKVSRTSSQDSGVQHDSDIVVATASLEVGYNDPAVGAVLQHKSPRGVASYLQRKGRAGRKREMRPWMIAVLSDFGRDRETYQHYEKLLDPEVKLQGLPINNSHIQRMQAAMATLNWFELKIGGVHLWTALNFPRQKNALAPKLALMLNYIEDVLQSGIVQDELVDYLQKSLKIDDHQMISVLWQPPRSIMMEFLPTLRRRLKTLWGRWDESGNSLAAWAEVNTSWGSPVPDFIPSQLFSDLNLPTVDISLDRGPQGFKSEGMSFFQALKEFAPGRISKRFSTHSGQSSDWVLPEGFLPVESDDGASKIIETDQIFGNNRDDLGDFEISPGTRIKVIKPYTIKTQSLFNSQQIADTSNAFLSWHSDFQTINQPEQHPPPKASLWKDSLQSLDFYTHRSMTPVEITRFNTGSTADIKFKRTGNTAKIAFSWQESGAPVAVGTRQSVDGIKLHYSIIQENVLNWLDDKELLASLRISFFQDQLRKSPLVGQNPFTADWLFECFMAAFLAEVSDKSVCLEEAIKRVAAGSNVFPLVDIPFSLFQQNAADANPDQTVSGPELADQKLQKDLVDLLEQATVVQEVTGLAHCLYASLSTDPIFIQWCFTLLGNTLSSALKQAITILLPDADERSLLADPEFDANNQEHVIWLSEEDSGGTGIITQLQDLHAEDPLQLLNVFAQHLQNSEYEQLDTDLVNLLKDYNSNADVRQVIAGVRGASDIESRISANKALKQTLTTEGVHFSHSFASVLHSRILKPGSSEATDKTLTDYIAQWEALENKTDLELPINIVAFVLAYEKHDRATDNQLIFVEACAIQSVLWPRGAQLRASALQFYNPFRMDTNNRTERKLAAKLCVDSTRCIDFSDPKWLTELHGELRITGRTDLVVPKNRHTELNAIVALLHTKPIDAHGLLVYPRIIHMRHHAQNITLRIELAESVF
ncbi:protein DpdJ [Pseudomonadales bacterium]|nr:protein DpdJ [Pseudomonadales bacterium]